MNNINFDRFKTDNWQNISLQALTDPNNCSELIRAFIGFTTDSVLIVDTLLPTDQ